VLHKRVGELQEASDLEGPDAHRPAGDRLVWVRIEERKVVLDVQGLHPLRLSVRKGRTEADSIKVLEVRVDAGRPPHELAMGAEQPAVVFEPVNPDFKAAPLE